VQWIHAALLVLLATTEVFAAEEGANTLYAGTVGGKSTVTMELSPNGGTLKGSYHYGKRPDVLTLNGTVAPSGDIVLTEKDPRGKATGKISGELHDGCIKGEWSSLAGTRRLPLRACALSKKQVLTAAVGTYQATAGEGSIGANGMFEIVKSGKKWSEQGMDYALTADDSGLWYFENMGNLTPATTFIHGRLFLAAIHEVDYSDFHSDYFPTRPGRLIVTYLAGVDRFEIQMGQLTLILTRR